MLENYIFHVSEISKHKREKNINKIENFYLIQTDIAWQASLGTNGSISFRVNDPSFQLLLFKNKVSRLFRENNFNILFVAQTCYSNWLAVSKVM